MILQALDFLEGESQLFLMIHYFLVHEFAEESRNSVE